MDESGRRSSPSPAYVIGDVHGHRAELVAALLAAGLVEVVDTEEPLADSSVDTEEALADSSASAEEPLADADEEDDAGGDYIDDIDGDDYIDDVDYVDAGERVAWAGGAARVWFLGDFFDRGPDGVAVVDLVMSLSEQAEAAGGCVRALLGNHEILTLGMHRFGDTEVPSDFGSRSFERSWRLNGGQPADQEALQERHLAWLRGLPVLARADDHLLMHSDTTEYFGWGDTVDEINATVAEVLAGDDIERWWDCWRRMTTRYAFRGPDGPETADKVLAALGGRRIVHGHSVIADQLGVPPPMIEGPCLYADGKVLGVDGGVFVGGPCLVVPLSDDSDVEEVDGDADEPVEPATESDLIDTEGVETETEPEA